MLYHGVRDVCWSCVVIGGVMCFLESCSWGGHDAMLWQFQIEYVVVKV